MPPTFKKKKKKKKKKCWFLFQGTAVLASPLNGQFYVIGNPSEVLGGSRTLAPRFSLDSSTSASAVNSNPRHDRRRATHNEVERRRRDNINAWIMKLGRLIPPGDAWHSTLNIQWVSEIQLLKNRTHSKTGPFYTRSTFSHSKSGHVRISYPQCTTVRSLH